MPKTSRLIARTSKWISLSMGRCLSLNHKVAVLRILACFLFTTDSWGKPYSSLLRYFTSTNLKALFFLNMRSISPNRQRKLWATIVDPFFSKNARAKRSPFLPIEVLLMSMGSNLDRLTENAEIYGSRVFRLVKFHEISAVFDGRKRPTPYSRSPC